MVRTAVFVAAGLGSRLKDRTERIPKGFLELEGEALVLRSLRLLRRAGIENILFGTGYHSQFYEALAQKDSRIVCVKSEVYKDTSSFYTLINMRDHIKEDFLLLESDLIYEPRALEVLLADSHRDVILASGKTNSGDEVYLETNGDSNLVGLSKDRTRLKSVFGELVGISRISYPLFQKLCGLADRDGQFLKKADYEHALELASSDYPIRVNKVDDLIWAEIDDESHLNRVKNEILPKLR